MRRLAPGLVAALLLGGCAGQPRRPESGGAIRGTVLVTGAHKRPAPVFDPRSGGDIDPETLVMDSRGRLANVFVHIKKGLEGRNFPIPAEPARMEGRRIHFEPRVIGIRTGQTLVYRRDPDRPCPCFHVVSRTPSSAVQHQVSPGEEFRIAFPSSEVMVRVSSDMDPWRVAWIGVLPHPYFAVTGPDGTFAFDGLPTGYYELEAWHEKLGRRTMIAHLAGGETRTVAFEFE